MNESVEYLLRELGFSGLEADIYLAVMTDPDSTGYRISQLLGKAAPNIYKALDSLVSKGAVIADEGGKSRTFVAVPVGELAEQMSHRLKTLAVKAEKGLESLRRPGLPEGVYHLNSVHQVMSRARRMLTEASVTVVIDGDVAPIMELREDLEAAASIGVKVLLHTRDRLDVAGCEVITSCTEGWPGEMLMIVVDSDQYMAAFMTGKMQDLSKAVWSRNFLAPCLHRSYMAKALFYRVAMMLGEERAPSDDVRLEVIRLWESWGYSDSGKQALLEVLQDR